MGLFDKKYCSVCGKEIGLLGNRKVEDGNLCKDCASKLSPWFTGRRKTTVEDIKAQLAYREENKKKLENFHPTLTLGNGSTKIYVDEPSQTFVVSRIADWKKNNSDLLSLSDVRDCVINVEEDAEEIYQEVDDKEVSYDPKRYKYEYTFKTEIKLDHPFISEIEFDLIDKPVESKESEEYQVEEYNGKVVQHVLMPNRYPSPGELVLHSPANTSGETWTCECGTVNNGGKFCSECGKERPKRWYCPECGKENYGKFCIECGHKKP